MSNLNVLWQPIKNSSQEIAVDTRADETLYCGTRGGGKSDTQLMAFAKYVGMGYGRYWRGIIFDQEYKNLDDLIVKSRRIFGKMPNAKYNIKDSKWTWSTGEELLFRRLRQDSDYWLYHGHEYCLADNEEVLTENGYKAIKDIEVGEKLLTLDTGYQKVSKKFDVGFKNCVKASVYTLDGRLYSEQLQSEDHRLLTNEAKFQKQQLLTLRSVPLFVETSDLAEYENILLDDVYQENRYFFVELVCGKIYAILLRMLRQNIQQDHSSRRELGLLLVVLLYNLATLRQKPTLYHNVLKSSVLSLVSKVNRLKILSDRPHTQELMQQVFHHLSLNLNVLQADDFVVWRKVLNLITRCFSDFGLSDELAHIGIKNDLYSVLLQLCEEDSNLEKTLGVLGDVLKHIRLSQYEFSHPYQKDKLCRSNFELSLGFVFVRSYKKLHCFDVEVETSNHYITKSGLVNKNCFIGFNELTKYPTSYLYDTIQSCNRSGFVPEEHPQYTIDGKVYYLPPIPLMLFSTTNPFGAGHNWVKKRFIDVAPYGTVVKRQTKVFNPKTKQEELVEKTQVALFSSYIENIYLSSNYIASLLNYPDPNIRRAWALGSWDIISGGAVGDLWNKDKHVINRFVIPDGWYIDRTFDWGSSHPFSVGWWARANGEEADVLLDNGEWIKFCPPKGSLIQFYEWYGTKEIGTNKGLKMSARDIAKGINQIEHGLIESGWIKRTVASGSADNQIWNNNNTDNDCIADIMESENVYWERSNKASGSRVNGLQLFRDMLKNTTDNAEQPHIYFMNNCIASISTIPVLPRDEKKIDDVDTSAEDHAYDMVRYRILDGVGNGSILLNVEYANA